jgi:hypothetical protein
MVATMMVSFLSLACLLVWFAAVWVNWLCREQFGILMTKISLSYLLFYGLYDLKIAGGDEQGGR